MKQWYMISLVGRDRSGIVAAVTRALFEAGATLGETTMARLGCNFTIMMMVEAEVAREVLQQALATVAAELGLHLHIDTIDPGLHQHQIPDLRVVVHGADRPGIVAQVTTALADSGFTITDLDSQVGGSAEQPIYILLIEGVSEAGEEPVTRALAPLAETIQFRVEEIDTLIG